MNLRGISCKFIDEDGSADWNNITLKEQTHRARYNGDSSHYSNTQHEEILNLRKLLDSRTKILKENEDRLVSRESVLEQAYVAIEQLQVQRSTLIEENLSELDDKTRQCMDAERLVSAEKDAETYLTELQENKQMLLEQLEARLLEITDVSSYYVRRGETREAWVVVLLPKQKVLAALHLV
jgi:seryl-tRNA synthetase